MRILKILDRKEQQTRQISLCGKLEAIVGHYDLAGVGLYDIETLYYDPNVGMYDVISKSKDKIVAYFLENNDPLTPSRGVIVLGEIHAKRKRNMDYVWRRLG